MVGQALTVPSPSVTPKDPSFLKTISVQACGTAGDVGALRDVWEATSFRIEREQSAEETVEQEQRGLAAREAPRWSLPYTPTWTPEEALAASDKPRVAVLRCAASCIGSSSAMCWWS